jgi:hypothetical protein
LVVYSKSLEVLSLPFLALLLLAEIDIRIKSFSEYSKMDEPVLFDREFAVVVHRNPDDLVAYDFFIR